MPRDEQKLWVVSIIRGNRIFRKSPLVFYLVFFVATSLPFASLLILFPPFFIDDWIAAIIWKGGLGWSLPWHLMAISCAAPTLIMFLLETADKRLSEAIDVLKKVVKSGENVTSTKWRACMSSPLVDLGGVVVWLSIFLFVFWDWFMQGVPFVTMELHSTWPVAVYMSLNFFAWWFLASEFALFMMVLTLFFIFKVRKLRMRCQWDSLNLWIRSDYVGGLKPVGACMLRIFRWFLLIVTLAVIGFWLFKYRGYLIFLLYASLFPIFSYVAIGYSLHAVVERTKKDLFKTADTWHGWRKQSSLFHYITQIDEWPMPFKTLGEPFWATIFWFLTSFVIPLLAKASGT